MSVGSLPFALEVPSRCRILPIAGGGAHAGVTPLLQGFLIALLILPHQSPAPSVTDVGWLAGCWTMTAGSRTVTELWLGPDGGTMIGLSRTVSGGKTVEYEFLLIRQGPGGLEYVAKPSRQPEAVFTSTRIETSEIVFENPAHDFPTRIPDRRQSPLLGAPVNPKRIERGIQPTACPPASARHTAAVASSAGNARSMRRSSIVMSRELVDCLLDF